MINYVVLNYVPEYQELNKLFNNEDEAYKYYKELIKAYPSVGFIFGGNFEEVGHYRVLASTDRNIPVLREI